jgi:hypothetical protein
MTVQALTPRARVAVLFAAIGGLLFDGFELGLMPVASLSVSQDLLGAAYTPTLGGDWFARFTAGSFWAVWGTASAAHARWA